MIVVMPYFLQTFAFREAQERLILRLPGTANTFWASADMETVCVWGGDSSTGHLSSHSRHPQLEPLQFHCLFGLMGS